MELVFLSLSIILNTGLIISYLLLRKQVKQHKNLTTIGDAGMLLRDLLNGDGLVRITRIVPEDVLLRSPRHNR